MNVFLFSKITWDGFHTFVIFFAFTFRININSRSLTQNTNTDGVVQSMNSFVNSPVGGTAHAKR